MIADTCACAVGGIVYGGYNVRFPWRPHIPHLQQCVRQVRQRKVHDPLRAVIGGRGIRCCLGLPELRDCQGSSPSSASVDV